jgi:predicted pyridoxine 5'-phosphate oxidase superfamily flavin-nucleotide-binding protein
LPYGRARCETSNAGANAGVANLSPAIVEALAGERTPKFLATLNADGVPNVVPIISLQAADESTVIFGEFMMWKTRQNLEVNPRVSVAVMTAREGWVIKGDFLEFQRSGPYFDQIMASDTFRYNAYAGIRNAGVIRVESIVRAFALSGLAVLLDMARARWFARRARRRDVAAVTVPVQVRQKFGRLKAAKFLAYLDGDGYPDIVPALSLIPADEQTFVFDGGLAAPALAALSPGARVAASVLTFEPLAYQIKGEFLGAERSLGRLAGVIAVQEVYSASPPLPGKQIA